MGYQGTALPLRGSDLGVLDKQAVQVLTAVPSPPSSRPGDRELQNPSKIVPPVKKRSLQTSPSQQWSRLGRGRLGLRQGLSEASGSPSPSWGLPAWPFCLQPSSPCTHPLAHQEHQGHEMPSMYRVQSPFSKESEFLGSNSRCCGLGYPLCSAVGMVRLSLGYELYSRPCLAPSFCVGGGGTPPSLRLQP